MDPDTHDGRVSDEALMARVQADDPAAFAQLYDRHAIRALRIARWSCSSHTHAEDAVQEASLSAWRNRAGEAVSLRASLGRLPSAQGEVIHLAYYGGLPQVEIATRLALPLETVKGRIRLGLTKLRVEALAKDPAV